MDDPLINTGALGAPRNRRLFLVVGLALLALIVVGLVWRSTGTRGARRELVSATGDVADKQREVDDARRVLDTKLAELRALRAEADVKATRLGGAVDEKVSGVVDEASGDAGRDYYVRNERGEFVRVNRP